MSRVSVRIRPVEHADVPGLVRLVSAVGVGAGEFSGRPLDEDGARLAARVRGLVDSGERDLLCAVDEHDEVVGLLVANTEDVGVIEPVPALHVTHLMVTPSYRRRGVGRLLLAASVHLADQRGIDRLLATVGSGSRESNRYLARLGFAPMVQQRVATTTTLRRSLGLADAPQHLAVLRRARLARSRAGHPAVRALGHGA